MKFLVTGGSGFVGSALINRLLSSDQEVLNFDRNSPDIPPIFPKPLKNRKKLQQIKGDICDEEQLENAFRQFQPDAVVHLAAEIADDQDARKQRLCVKTNHDGTLLLLEAAHHYWKNLPLQKQLNFRFLYLSAAEVFAPQICPDHRISELDAIYAPKTPYLASKIASEHLVKAWQNGFDFPTLLIYASNIYGPGQHPKELIPHLLLAALQEKQVSVNAKDESTRDWLYIEDCVEVIYQALTQAPAGEAYNISSYTQVSELEIARQLYQLLDGLGCKKTSYLNLIDYKKTRPDYPQHLALDSSKIRKQLDWQPRETLLTGLEKTLLWYQNNASWIEKKIQKSTAPKIRRKQIIQGI